MLRKLSYLQRCLAFQWLPRGAVQAYQLRALQRIVGFAERAVPLYRETFRRAGVRAADLRSVEDLRHFPTLTREQVVAAYPDGILSRVPRADDIVFRTSGTSGLFMQIAYSAKANDWLDAVYARALFNAGYRPWDRFAYMWWEAEPKALRTYEKLGLMRKVFLPVTADPRVYIAQLRELKPDIIYIFPSVLMMIARIVENEKITDILPRAIIAHGELMPKEIQAEAQRIFGCKVYNQYGAQEFNRIGWECSKQRGMHLDADSVCLEVLDGERHVDSGAEGEIVLTGLHNDLMPLIRYRTGDLGRHIPTPCSCGRGLPMFEVTEGRLDDVITLADGRRIGPRSLAPPIERLQGFTQYRLVQKSLDQIEVLLVCEPNGDPDAPANVARTLADIVGGSVRIDVKRVAAIPLSQRGKLRKVVSEVARST